MKKIVYILLLSVCSLSWSVNFHAIIVGVSKYKNLPEKKQLQYADADAKSFYDFLIAHNDVKPEHAKLIVNEEATAPYVKKELYLTLLKNAQSGDFVYVYFAGHGDVDADIGDGFFLMHDVEPGQDYFISDALPISDVKRMIAQASHRGVNVILITDACRSGNIINDGAEDGPKYTTKALLDEWQNMVKFVSCQPNQFSYEDEKWGNGHGVFTYYLLKALEGEADEDGDQFLRMGEVYDFVRSKVKKETEYRQIPKASGNETMYILRVDKTAGATGFMGDTWFSSLAPMTLQEMLEGELPRDKQVILDAFYVQLKKRRFFKEHENAEPAADDLFNKMLADSAFKDVLEFAKMEYTFELEQGVSGIIGPFVKGNPIHPPISEVEEALRRMNRASELSKGEPIFYDKLHAQELFLKAFLILEKNDITQYDKAVMYFEEILHYQPNAAYPLVGISEVLSRRRLYTKSKKSLKQALAKSPSWVNANSQLGNVYKEVCNCDYTEEIFQRLIDRNPESTSGQRDLAEYKLSFGEYEESEELLHKALEQNSNDAILLSDLGYVHHLLGHFSTADSLYSASGISNDRFYKNYLRVRHNLRALRDADSLSQNDYERLTNKVLQEAKKVAPYNPEVLVEIGDFYSEMLSEHESYYVSSELNSFDPLTSRKEQITDSKIMMAYQNALSYDPYYERAYLGLALTSLVFHGDTATSEMMLLKAAKEIKSSRCQRNLFLFYDLTGDFKKAEKSIQNAIKLDERNYDYYITYYEWLVERNESKASRVKAKILGTFPDSQFAKEHSISE